MERQHDGRRLFLQALDYCFCRQYGQAAAAFDAAATLGNGDACFHLYCQFVYAGCCRTRHRGLSELLRCVIIFSPAYELTNECVKLILTTAVMSGSEAQTWADSVSTPHGATHCQNGL